MIARRVWAVLAVLLSVAAVAAGCGGEDPPPFTESTPAVQWGQAISAGPVDVMASEPEDFTSSRSASPRDTEGWRAVLVITNRSSQPVSPAAIRVYASEGGAPRWEIVDPVSGCNGLSSAAPIPPGGRAGVTTCWQGSDGDRRLAFVSPSAGSMATFGES